MFTNKAFNVAFLISLAWHLLCMSAVSIVVLPGKYKTRELTSVSFLGPILKKTVLEIMLANKPVAVTTRYQHSLKYTHSFNKKDKLSLEDVTGDEAKKHISTHAIDIIGKVSGMALPKDKEIPNMVRGISEEKTYFRSSNKISSPIVKREVIYKPKKPRLPSWIAASPPFKLELEFSVSAQGEVKEVVPIVSSGDPEVDLLGIRYLKCWRFTPLAQGLDGGEKDRIRFIFGEED